MRTCQSCGKENPADRDFCSCGEYLRWEPTSQLKAITPEMIEKAATQAPPPPAAAPPPPPQAAAPPPPLAAVPPPAPKTPAPPADAAPSPPPPPQGAPVSTTAPHANVAPPPPPGARVEKYSGPETGDMPAPGQSAAPAGARWTGLMKAVPNGNGQAAAPPAEQNEPATIVLRLPDGDPAKGEVLHQTVEPGQRDRVLALIRNQSGIVDNYDLTIEGMPAEWYSIFPSTVYLVPFGSGGTYEQEVEIHLHPPRSPEAVARQWDLRVVAHSRAHLVTAADAPLALHVEPYIETATTLRPQRKKGRRKADYDVTVVNKANAPVLVALEGEDPDAELQYGFNRPPQEIPPGGSVTTEMRVKPPKKIWIGRGKDWRFEAKTLTGEEAAERAAAEPLAADVLKGAPIQGRRKGIFRRRQQPQVPGVYGPRVYRPQVYPPGVQLGPGGIQLRMPSFTGPHVQGPQLGSVNPQQFANKLPGRPKRGGAATPQAPLMPTQGVFRQRAIIPWWVLLLLALLLLLLLLLYMLLPSNVTVPKVVGQKSAFTAEKQLTAVKLKLDPNQKQKVDAHAPGTVIDQTPKPGASVAKGTPVTILVAVGSGKVEVPSIVGKTASEADQILRAKQLTLGQASPQPVDPKGKISSQIPAANSIVNRGSPVNFFYPDPSSADAKKKAADKKNGKGGGPGGAAAGGGPGGGAGAADIIVPAINGADLKAYAKKAGDLGIVPEEARQFNDAPPGTLFATDPAGGTKVAKGAKVKLLVSNGQPQILFTNGKNILRIDGATGKKTNVANGPQDEEDPTWSADGSHVAYTADKRVTLRDITKKDAPAVPLTRAGEDYENVSWAPTADINVLAMNIVKSDGDNDLCLGQITKDGVNPQCISEPSFTVIRAIHWAPDGKAIYAVGVKNPTGSGIFGIVRWKLEPGKKAFSPDPNDWTKGHFVSDIGTPGKGVLDAAFSPDGSKVAVVSNQGGSTFRLWFAKPNDLLLSSATATPVRACKVAWRSDSKEVVVVQSDAGCTEDVGSLVRLAVNDVRDQKELNAAGDDPSFQPPVSAGG